MANTCTRASLIRTRKEAQSYWPRLNDVVPSAVDVVAEPGCMIATEISVFAEFALNRTRVFPPAFCRSTRSKKSLACVNRLRSNSTTTSLPENPATSA